MDASKLSVIYFAPPLMYYVVVVVGLISVFVEFVFWLHLCFCDVVLVTLIVIKQLADCQCFRYNIRRVTSLQSVL
jgi:hypothetical protein